MEDILAIILIFGGGTAFLLAISPIGRAFAHRIRGGGGGGGGGEAGPAKMLEELRDSQIAVLEDLDVLKQEVNELQERLDFTERMLAKHREVGRGQLPGSSQSRSSSG